MDREEMRKVFKEWADGYGLHPIYERHDYALAWIGWQAAMAHSCEGKAELVEALKDCVEALSHLQDRLAVRVNPPTLENALATLSRHGG